jgi:hypothetical protein
MAETAATVRAKIIKAATLQVYGCKETTWNWTGMSSSSAAASVRLQLERSTCLYRCYCCFKSRIAASAVSSSSETRRDEVKEHLVLKPQ